MHKCNVGHLVTVSEEIGAYLKSHICQISVVKKLFIISNMTFCLGSIMFKFYLQPIARVS